MIKSFQHKGLKLLWGKDDPSKLPAHQLPKIRSILTLMDSAAEIRDMNFPGSDLHPLKGDLKGFWSIKVSANYRITFRLEEGEIYDVDYIDYH